MAPAQNILKFLPLPPWPPEIFGISTPSCCPQKKHQQKFENFTPAPEEHFEIFTATPPLGKLLTNLPLPLRKILQNLSLPPQKHFENFTATSPFEFPGGGAKLFKSSGAKGAGKAKFSNFPQGVAPLGTHGRIC